LGTPAILRAQQRKYRAVIIGHTGEGNYGHELDLVFTGRPNIQVLAVADPDPAGRARSADRSGALRQYAQYEEMLDREKPDLVSIAPRWSHQHHSMAKAALQAGAHLFVEKPFMRTLAEADEIIELAEKKGRKIAVAHQMRIAPNVVALQQLVASGGMGEVIEIRSHGKQDHRAGGEDLVVLGVHIFDLMRYFAGDAAWCMASIRAREEFVTKSEIRRASENIGPVVGDEIQAAFGFRSGVFGRFTSKAALRETLGPWGLQVVGTKGAFMIQLEMIPRIFKFESSKWQIDGARSQWLPWPEDPTRQFSSEARSIRAANGRVLDGLLGSIESGAELPCSGLNAARAMEFYMAVFESGITGKNGSMPMRNRFHPLETQR
jgi:predicted dehydrogenase